MILDEDIKSQLSQYLKLMEGDVLLKVSAGSDSVSKDMLALINELTNMSLRIKVKKNKLQRTPSFSVDRPNEDTGIVFAGVPLGHEFTSLVLSLLQVSGRAPKIDNETIEQIKDIKGTYNFETYVSLSCNNCPEVVQSLNLMSILNPNIKHTMIDGAVFKKEIESKNIMAVPSIYLNGTHFGTGRMTLTDILSKIGSTKTSKIINKNPYDVLIVGGGPAGASAAIYAARKGIRTGIIAERFGGQVMDTVGIENLIGTKYIEGSKLSANLEEHVKEYNVDIITSQRAVSLKKNELIEVQLENGPVLKSKTAIISTGARWRDIGVPGEKELKNKGVTYCPHCDGPLFKGKNVAVIGGGNSGVEAAIDLAGIVNHVTIIEYMPELKSDVVLKNRLGSLPNVTVINNAETKEITGSDKVDGITYIDRSTGGKHHIEIQGVFVQIGLVPNTSWIDKIITRNPHGEIVTDNHAATNLPGVFAAGDCTNSPYKQIIISMGSGATAALSAFDYLIRN
ncbi:alkyl hydroperoxide reductase subunit F [Clostridium sp. LBM24168]